MKIRLVVALVLVGLAIGFVLPTFAQQKDTVDPKIAQQQAYWMDRTRIAIPSQYLQSDDSYAITTSITGGLNVTNSGIIGGSQISLAPGGTLTQDELTRYPPALELRRLADRLHGSDPDSSAGA